MKAKSTVMIAFAALLACCYSNCPCAASTISQLNCLVDGSANDANHDGVWDTWEPASEVLLAYNALPTGYNIRAALEFDLGSIPAGSTINSAVLKVRYEFASGSPTRTLQFNSYVGDGILRFADFPVNNQIGPIYSAFGPDDHSGYYNVPATSWVQSLIDTHSRYSGFMIENILWNQTAFMSTRASNSSDRPVLLIDYTAVPEPSTFALFGTVVCLLLGCAWRRQ